jgi:hypothetical protein
MGAFTKRWLIKKRRTRRQKLDRLRRLYVAARSDTERTSIIAKARQVSPQISPEQFLSPIQSGSTILPS